MNIRHLSILSILLTVCVMGAFARDDASAFSLHGEIHSRGSWQSRESRTDWCGLYDGLPSAPAYNRIGREMNEIASWNLSDVATRLSACWGTTAFDGFRIDVKAEAELTHFRQNTNANLGEAYFRVSKVQGPSNLSLLVGQAWHPMAKDKPDVLSVYGEAPFNPYNLSPMIDFGAAFGRFEVQIAAIGQGRFTSTGPSGRSTEYLSYAIPEILLQLSYVHDGTTLRLGADYLSPKPTIRTTYLEVPMWTTSEAHFFSYYAYAGIRIGKFNVQAKGLFTNGAEHLGTLGGYALSETYRGVQNIYTPYRTLTAWANVSYGEKLKYGLFAGYIRNLGTARPVADALRSNVWYTEGMQGIVDAVRAVPSVRYCLGGGFSAGLEYEFTLARFGSGRMTEDGLYNGDPDSVRMNRVSMSLSYRF